MGDSLHFSGKLFPVIMNFSFHNGFKAWSAVVLAVLALVLFWPSHEKDSSQTTVREPHNSLDDQKLVLTDSGQRHQDATAQVTAEPASQPSNTASVGSIADRNILGSSRDHIDVELVDRTPRPFQPRPFKVQDCPNNLDWCITEQALVTEPIDPSWSSVTEGRLRDIWRDAVAEMSDEFLFVECKTTVCEVTYRFPQGTTRDDQDRYFSQFLVALRASDLAAELRLSNHLFASFGWLAQARYFERTTSQSEPQANSKTSQ